MVHKPNPGSGSAKENPLRDSALGRSRALIWSVMALERLWPLILPFVVLGAFILSFAWLGLFRVLPDIPRIAILAVFAGLALIALWRLRGIRMPQTAEIDQRIERANGLRHTPISVQTDQLAADSDDPFARALWEEHQRRMALSLDKLHGDLPQTRIPVLDPFGIRAVAALLFVVALAYSTGPYRGHLADAFRPLGGSAAVERRIDAWITPPAYTGKAPLFLTAANIADRPPITVPANSVLTVRVSPGAGDETLRIRSPDGNEELVADNPGTETTEESAGSSAGFTHALAQTGTVTLYSGRRELGSWSIAVVEDTPPSIRFADLPRRAASGALEFGFEGQDDYGVTKVWATFELPHPNAGTENALVEAPELPLTLSQRTGNVQTGRVSRDLSEHPWAGLDVVMSLHAQDAVGQIGESEAERFVLPQRNFTNLLARALLEQRRILALDAGQRREVLALMDAVLLWADETITEPSQFLLVSALRGRLARARTKDALRSIVDDMWQIALIIDQGSFSAAEQRLRNAQENLRQALENGASDQEISSLMDELRNAMNEYLREFAQRAAQQPNTAMSPSDGTLTPQDLDQLLKQLQDLSQSGAKEQALDMLSQLEQLMNNLQAGQGKPQSGEQSAMQQQMNEFGDLLRQQQELLNETFRLNQSESGASPMAPDDRTETLKDLQERQNALRQNLTDLMQSLRQQGLTPGEDLGDAGEFMGGAAEALGDGGGFLAESEQGKAIEALRRGARNMMNQMQQAMDGDGGGQGMTGQGKAGQRPSGLSQGDPLGRSVPQAGDFLGIPQEGDRSQARRILDEIYRRLGDMNNSQVERQYLERLLNIE